MLCLTYFVNIFLHACLEQKKNIFYSRSYPSINSSALKTIKISRRNIYLQMYAFFNY